MKIYRLELFKTNYQQLDKSIQKMTNKKLCLMAKDPFHPSLRTKKIQGTTDIFEASINMNYRITWQYYQDGILLRNIGKHDRTLKDP